MIYILRLPVFKSVTNSKLRNVLSIWIRSKCSSELGKLIDGKAIAADIRAELREEVEAFVADGNRRPQLTAILVGNNPASNTYVKNKMKASKDVGIDSRTQNLPDDTKEEDLLNLIDKLNKSDDVDGILIQLPLPEHISESRVCNAVTYEKDVDGFSEVNVGRLTLSVNSMVPCTPKGVQVLIQRENIKTKGKNVVVLGRSKNVGLPLALIFHSDNKYESPGLDATVTICHRYTPSSELKVFCKQADIIITATGIHKVIKADMVKEGACVIDVGITKIKGEDGKFKMVGDVDFEEVRKVAGHITPVPGGVGPMTVAMLMQNTVTAAKRIAERRKMEENDCS